MEASISSSAPHADPRRRALLEAALAVFARYGYQKTSMEEVARAAQVSRQGLYLHFSTKEALFQAAVEQALEDSSAAAALALSNASLALEQRLVRAFDEWIGRYVGLFQGNASDLMEATSRLSGSMVARFEEGFAELVTKTIRGSRLLSAYKPAGVTARQLTETLLAAVRGLKHSSKTRPEFVRGLTIAVKVMCAPLSEHR